jgi:hypothetical protein
LEPVLQDGDNTPLAFCHFYSGKYRAKEICEEGKRKSRFRRCEEILQIEERRNGKKERRMMREWDREREKRVPKVSGKGRQSLKEMYANRPT